MSEPTIKELLERLKKADATASALVDEIAEQREDIEEMRQVISLMNERLKSIEKQTREHRDLDGAIVDHGERLCALEGKIFPGLWPTIHRVEAVLGELDNRYDLHDPLDHRKEKKT